MNSRIAVISCVWQRPERLRYTLAQLGKQTHPLHLYLIVNNAAHGDMVDVAVRDVDYPVTVIHNAENRGPYARIETMHDLAAHYDYFMTIDDDAVFGEGLLAQWWQKRQPKAMQGWRGWSFTGNYWQRIQVNAGQPCHYLFGSNLFVPAAAVSRQSVLDLAPEYWQCDDLWLCYHANNVAGLQLVAQDVPMAVEVDGKDTYPTQHHVKVRLLDELRGKGWKV